MRQRFATEQRDPLDAELARRVLDLAHDVSDCEALAAGVERIVYTSSVAALRVAGATAPVDEAATLSPEEAIGAYKRSKTMAERAVEEMILREGLPAIIVSPTTPIGPRATRWLTLRACAKFCRPALRWT